jgi:hypothetical protein
MGFPMKRPGKTLNTGAGGEEKGAQMNDSSAGQKTVDAAVAWFEKFERLDQLDWLTILLAVLVGNLTKRASNWFLDWVLPFVLLIAGYKMRRKINEVLETRCKQ